MTRAPRPPPARSGVEAPASARDPRPNRQPAKRKAAGTRGPVVRWRRPCWPAALRLALVGSAVLVRDRRALHVDRQRLRPGRHGRRRRPTWRASSRRSTSTTTSRSPSRRRAVPARRSSRSGWRWSAPTRSSAPPAQRPRGAQGQLPQTCRPGLAKPRRTSTSTTTSSSGSSSSSPTTSPPQAALDAGAPQPRDARRRSAPRCSEQLAGIAANLNGDPNAPVEDHPQLQGGAGGARRGGARARAHGRRGADSPAS